jgi:hypothetical protein
MIWIRFKKKTPLKLSWAIYGSDIPTISNFLDLLGIQISLTHCTAGKFHVFVRLETRDTRFCSAPGGWEYLPLRGRTQYERSSKFIGGFSAG